MDSDSYFYENKFPVMNELVMVTINSIDDIGVLCSLLEYNNIEGYIAMSEVSRQRMRSISQHVRIGQKHILQVVNVIPDNNYVELSKKYVDENEIIEGTEKYNNSKTVHNIVKYLAEMKNVGINEIYELMIYPLYETYDNPYLAFKLIASDNTYDIYSKLDIIIPDGYLESLIKIIKQQFTIQPIKICTEIDITSFVGGINDIKYALNVAKNSAPRDYDVKIQLVASPTFAIFTTTTNEIGGTEAISSVSNVVKNEITKIGGNFICKNPPYVVCG